MQNPALKALKSGQPFVYFHTYTVDQPTLDTALAAKKSLEIDIAMDADGTDTFIGHPLSFYEFKHMNPPNNLALNDVVDQLEDSDLYTVLDIKDVRALPKAAQISKRLGPENCLMHTWAQELCFTPYPNELIIEPHWVYEDLPRDAIAEWAQQTSVPVILSCRGLTRALLESGDQTITDRILLAAQGLAIAVNFNLPDAQAPPKHISEALQKVGIATWLSIDHVPAEDRPPTYIGATDHIAQASAF